MKIHLTQNQHSVGIETTNKRQTSSNGGKQARGLDARKSNQVAKLGALGEIAFAVAYNLPLILSVDAWNDPDFIINNTCVDVKASTGDTLYISQRHFHKNWVYVLAKQLDEFTFELIGGIKACDLKPEWLCNPGNRVDSTGEPALCYRVKRSDLRPMPNPKKFQASRN